MTVIFLAHVAVIVAGLAVAAAVPDVPDSGNEAVRFAGLVVAGLALASIVLTPAISWWIA